MRWWVVCSVCGILGKRRYRQNAEMLTTEHEVQHPGHTAQVETKV